MIEIKDLLGRFNNILLGEEAKKEFVRSAISELIKVDIQAKDVIIKNNVIFLNIKPIYKNEVFLKKEAIFSKLGDYFGAKAPRGIR